METDATWGPVFCNSMNKCCPLTVFIKPFQQFDNFGQNVSIFAKK